MMDFTKSPNNSQEPGLELTKPKKGLQEIPPNMVDSHSVSQHALQHQPSGNARIVGCQHKPPFPTNKRSTPRPRPKHHPHKNGGSGTHRGSDGSRTHAHHQPKSKNQNGTQRSRRRNPKGSSSSSWTTTTTTTRGGARPPLPPPPPPPDRVLTRQGDILHRELDRVLRNGKMRFWQQHIFADVFRKMREALLALGSRRGEAEAEAEAPIITEGEYRARAYAREAFDRFKKCMEKV